MVGFYPIKTYHHGTFAPHFRTTIAFATTASSRSEACLWSGLYFIMGGQLGQSPLGKPPLDTCRSSLRTFLVYICFPRVWYIVSLARHYRVSELSDC